MIKRKVHIENGIELLKCLYSDIGNGRYKGLNLDDNSSLKELYFNVIISGSEMLSKTGLYKEYYTHENERLTSPKGVIDIGESIAQQTLFKGQLICSYDDLSANNEFNRIIKAALLKIKNSSEISDKIRLKCNIALKNFNGIDSIEINNKKLSRVRFNNSNIRYKTLISISKLIYNEEKYSKNKNNEYTDVDRLFCLFKLAYIKYYENLIKKDESSNKVIDRLLEVDYDLSNKPYEKEIIEKNQVLAIDNSERAVLIKVIKHDRESQSNSKNYQFNIDTLADMVKEYEKEYRIKTTGVILYVNTDYSIMVYQDLKIMASKEKIIGVDMIDLTEPWKYTDNKLKKIYKIFVTDGV